MRTPRRMAQRARPALLVVLACVAGLPACGNNTPEAAKPAAPASSAEAPKPAAAQSSPPAAAASDPDTENAWRPIYDFSLEVDGAPSWDARFYVHKEGQKILIAAPEVSAPAILNRISQDVGPIAPAAVRTQGDGDAAFIAPGNDTPASAIRYDVDEQKGAVIFYLGAQRLKITPKQALEGPATEEIILKHSPIYRKGKEAYVPQRDEIAYLHSVTRPVDIEVFFGTWCSHCKVFVPRFMKTIAAADNKALRVTYIGVPKMFNTFAPAQAKKVTGIPTFIFSRDGAEFARIPGEPTDGTIEEAIAKILRAAS